MATFRTYDRLLFAKLETDEGVVQTPAMTDYIETIEPSFNITNRVYDRNVTRKSISPMLKTVTGTGAGAAEPSASCEFTFGVELAGTGAHTATTWATEPKWSRFLQACGFVQSTMWRVAISSVADGGTRVPTIVRNKSNLSNELGGAGSAWDKDEFQGRCLGDLHFDDPYLYLAEVSGTTPELGATSDKYFSQAADQSLTGVDPYAVASAGLFKRGYGWSLVSDDRLGGNGVGGNASSLTIQLRLGLTGQYVEAVGCRGNVEFVFTSGDKCVMQFTFTGKLNQYDDTTVTTIPVPITQPVPPTVVGVSAAIQKSGFGEADVVDVTNAVFNDFSLNVGNELALREDMNDAVGYSSTYITGRTGSMSIGPDAGPASTTHTPWWDLLLSGGPVRMRMSLGTTAQDDANSFVFKMPALQFEQIGDGERENVMTYDITGSMTGGDNGSSVQEEMDNTTHLASSGSKILNSRLGTNNEFTLLYS